MSRVLGDEKYMLDDINAAAVEGLVTQGTFQAEAQVVQLKRDLAEARAQNRHLYEKLAKASGVDAVVVGPGRPRGALEKRAAFGSGELELDDADLKARGKYAPIEGLSDADNLFLMRFVWVMSSTGMEVRLYGKSAVSRVLLKTDASGAHLFWHDAASSLAKKLLPEHPGKASKASPADAPDPERTVPFADVQTVLRGEIYSWFRALDSEVRFAVSACGVVSKPHLPSPAVSPGVHRVRRRPAPRLRSPVEERRAAPRDGGQGAERRHERDRQPQVRRRGTGEGRAGAAHRGGGGVSPAWGGGACVGVTKSVSQKQENAAARGQHELMLLCYATRRPSALAAVPRMSYRASVTAN